MDFDTESRPLTYLGSDYTTAEITAIASAWVGQRGSMESLILGEMEGKDMLLSFSKRWDEADMVTGHNLIRHDLPRLNAMLLEQGMPALGPKLVQDTYLHLKRKNGVSGSQESLAEMLGVKAPKQGMSQVAWRQANRLLPEGLVKTRTRCVSDVVQHMALRARLLELQWLRNPRVWRP